MGLMSGPATWRNCNDKSKMKTGKQVLWWTIQTLTLKSCEFPLLIWALNLKTRYLRTKCVLPFTGGVHCTADGFHIQLVCCFGLNNRRCRSLAHQPSIFSYFSVCYGGVLWQLVTFASLELWSAIHVPFTQNNKNVKKILGTVMPSLVTGVCAILSWLSSSNTNVLRMALVSLQFHSYLLTWCQLQMRLWEKGPLAFFQKVMAFCLGTNLCGQVAGQWCPSTFCYRFWGYENRMHQVIIVLFVVMVPGQWCPFHNLLSLLGFELQCIKTLWCILQQLSQRKGALLHFVIACRAVNFQCSKRVWCFLRQLCRAMCPSHIVIACRVPIYNAWIIMMHIWQWCHLMTNVILCGVIAYFWPMLDGPLTSMGRMCALVRPAIITVRGHYVFYLCITFCM